MKLLAFSDIHDNLLVARKMRMQECNDFDAVIVAGDLGGNSTSKLFRILETFECPIIYVYGNQDHSLPYDRSFGNSTHLLHMSLVKHEQITFVGYSGSQPSWGHNPIAIKLLGKSQAQVKPTSADLEKKFLEIRRLGQLPGTRASEIAKLKKELSAGVQSYKSERKASTVLNREVLRLNREKLLETIEESKAPRERLVVITHERTPWEYLGGAALHVFGHRHGFNDRVYRGTRCINVSALDCAVTARPRRLRKWSYSDCRNINGGSYAVIEISNSGMISASCRRLPDEYNNWVPVKDQFIHGLACIPEEETFLKGWTEEPSTWETPVESTL